LAENLLLKWPSEIDSLTLIPSDGGVFEVEVDGDLIYSKKATGRHVEDGEVEELFEALIGSPK
jgi:selenoprotein W-related protein